MLPAVMKQKLLTLAVVALVSFPVPALAWSNGTDGPNSSGTRYLILDQADLPCFGFCRLRSQLAE